MQSKTMSLLESIQQNLTEAVELPTEAQSFTSSTKGKVYNNAEDACKLNAVKAYIDDNTEEIYAGSVKVDGNEITHFFNVKDDNVIDHSATAVSHDMTDYKGVPITSILKEKGFKINPSKLQFCQFQNDNGDIIECGNDENKLYFKHNGQEISYEDLKNL